MILEDLARPLRYFLYFSKLLHLGNRHDRIVFPLIAWIAPRIDPNGPQGSSRSGIDGIGNNDPTPLPLMPINEDAKANGEHRMDGEQKLPAIDFQRFRQLVIERQISSPAAVAGALGADFLDPIHRITLCVCGVAALSPGRGRGR